MKKKNHKGDHSHSVSAKKHRIIGSTIGGGKKEFEKGMYVVLLFKHCTQMSIVHCLLSFETKY